VKCNWAERWVVNNPFRVVEQRIEIKKLRRMRPLEPGFTALEIGCGRGAGAGIILDTFRPRIIYTTDLDVDMLDRAREYVRPEKMGRIRLVAADGSSLPFKTGSLDAVFGFGVLHHIPDWRRAIGEAARVLKAGGIYFFEELYPAVYQNFITKHILAHPREDRFRGCDLRDALGVAGFSLGRYSEWKDLGIVGAAVKEAL